MTTATSRTEVQCAPAGTIPDKMYFRIGEVAEIVGVKPYVLRYWESEFPVLRPQKSRTRQRMYRRRDVELLLRIKTLLYDRKYTIAGARQFMRRGGEGAAELLATEPVGAEHIALDLDDSEGPIDASPPLSMAAPPAPSAALVVTAVPMRETAAVAAVHSQVPHEERQLPLELRVSSAVRDQVLRHLEEILRLCDEHEEVDDGSDLPRSALPSEVVVAEAAGPRELR